MRGTEELESELWSYIPAEKRVPADHHLRPIRQMVDQVWDRLSPRLDKLYWEVGRRLTGVGRLVMWSMASRDTLRTLFG